jgi:hypothetical protein
MRAGPKIDAMLPYVFGAELHMSLWSTNEPSHSCNCGLANVANGREMSHGLVLMHRIGHFPAEPKVAG